MTVFTLNSELFIVLILPSHGNEEADWLVKEGGKLPQDEKQVGYDEAKTIVKENQRRRWLQQHPDYNNRDSYYQLSREDQVIMVRLEDWTFKTRAPYVHENPHWRIRCVPSLRCIAHDGGTLPAGLSNSPESGSRNLTC